MMVFMLKFSLLIVILMISVAHILMVETSGVSYNVKKMYLALGMLIYYIAYKLGDVGIMLLIYTLVFTGTSTWKEVVVEQKSLNDEVIKANKRIMELGEDNG